MTDKLPSHGVAVTQQLGSQSEKLVITSKGANLAPELLCGSSDDVVPNSRIWFEDRPITLADNMERQIAIVQERSRRDVDQQPTAGTIKSSQGANARPRHSFPLANCVFQLPLHLLSTELCRTDDVPYHQLPPPAPHPRIRKVC